MSSLAVSSFTLDSRHSCSRSSSFVTRLAGAATTAPVSFATSSATTAAASASAVSGSVVVVSLIIVSTTVVLVALAAALTVRPDGHRVALLCRRSLSLVRKERGDAVNHQFDQAIHPRQGKRVLHPFFARSQQPRAKDNGQVRRSHHVSGRVLGDTGEEGDEQREQRVVWRGQVCDNLAHAREAYRRVRLVGDGQRLLVHVEGEQRLRQPTKVHLEHAAHIVHVCLGNRFVRSLPVTPGASTGHDTRQRLDAIFGPWHAKQARLVERAIDQRACSCLNHVRHGRVRAAGGLFPRQDEGKRCTKQREKMLQRLLQRRKEVTHLLVGRRCHVGHGGQAKLGRRARKQDDI
mmetsp:Transcript_6990/g.22421  ORF Transcript_6990/g.22421 Transcript_6990/m.22421 type:complete len:348 (-) Transcript_6990:1014-2057(-)